MRKIKAIDDILHREVTRAEFLKLVGVAAVSVLGFSSIVSNLNSKTYVVRQSSAGRRANLGFGTRRFGE